MADALEKARSPSVFSFVDVVNGLTTGYWCSSGGCMPKSSWWQPCFLDNWGRVMNALKTEHSNLEIDCKLNRQPVKAYKWRCDVFMSWQWAHQSACRVLHPLELAKVRSGNTMIGYCNSLFWTIDFSSIFKTKKYFNTPNIMQMVTMREIAFANHRKVIYLMPFLGLFTSVLNN